MVCQLFGLSIEGDPDLRVFPPFEYGADPLDNSASQSALQHLLAELNMRLKTTEIDGSNEATRSEYVFSFLVAAASLFKNDIVIKPQKQLHGKYGRGPVDFALEARDSRCG